MVELEITLGKNIQNACILNLSLSVIFCEDTTLRIAFCTDGQQFFLQMPGCVTNNKAESDVLQSLERC